MTKRKKFWVFGVGGLIAVLVVVPGGVQYRSSIPFLNAASKLPALSQKAQDIGLPTTEAELFAQRPVTDGDNLWKDSDTLRALCLSYKKAAQPPHRLWSFRLTQADESEIQRIKHEMASVEPIIKELQRLVEKPKLCFATQLTHVDYSANNAIYSEGVAIVCSAAAAEAKLGRIPRALKLLELASRLSAKSIDEPGDSGRRLHFHAYGKVFEAVMNSLDELTSKPEYRKELDRILAEEYKPGDAAWWFKTDLVLTWPEFKKISASISSRRSHIFENPAQGIDFALHDPVPLTVSPETAQRACQAHLLAGFLTGVRKHQETGQTSDLYSASLNYWNAGLARNDASFFRFENFVTYMKNGESSALAVETRRNLILALLQIVDYKRKHGHLPVSLEDAGANLMDPMSGKPLQYRRENGRAIVYGYGFDLKDDSGIATQSVDMVMSYPARFPRILEITSRGQF
ncbi:MAG: hypothetical protein KF784_03630 [Fimbriimonadaceae bacterium]|nr:hypothetical protein [Fimbriimonadaceae bacterium]